MKQIIVWIGSAVCMLSVTLGVSAARGGPGGVHTEPDRSEQQHDRRCTNATLRGRYGFYRTGTTAQGPLAAVGMATYDGLGSFSATQTTSRNGVFTQGSFDGTYEVNSDCSGTLLNADGQTVTAYISLVDGGNELFMLSGSAGNSVTGVARRITRRTRR